MGQSDQEKSLFAAIRADDVVAVKKLIDAGCAVDIYDQQNDNALTPLHVAVGKNPLIAVLLFDAGAQANTADDGGFTPLMQAIAERDYAFARALVTHGADVNWQEADGKITALHAAVFAANRDSDMERVRFTLLLGADGGLTMRWQNYEALTPRELAVLLQSEAGDVVGILDSPELPERRLVHAARSAFVRGLSGRAQGDKKRYALK